MNSDYIVVKVSKFDCKEPYYTMCPVSCIYIKRPPKYTVRPCSLSGKDEVLFELFCPKKKGDSV